MRARISTPETADKRTYACMLVVNRRMEIGEAGGFSACALVLWVHDYLDNWQDMRWTPNSGLPEDKVNGFWKMCDGISYTF